MKYLAPYLLSLFIKRTRRNMMNDIENNQRRKSRNEGEVNVDYIPKKQTNKKKENLGDYTDFEEIKE